ncbi:TPA: fibronectin type III domain-containing protein [Pseudomonas putida]|nr:fibronectin type III domain-containing protein [Pseudomonas putida]
MGGLKTMAIAQMTARATNSSVSGADSLIGFTWTAYLILSEGFFVQIPYPEYMTAKSSEEDSINVTWAYGPASGYTGTRLKWFRADSGEPIGVRDLEKALKSIKIRELIPNTRYRIQAFGLLNDEESTNFAQEYATTEPANDLPASPTNLDAYPTRQDMELVWSGPPNATYYKISYGLAPSGPVIATQTSTSTTHIVFGLSSGTNYYFDVRSSNNNGDSAPTRIVKQTLQPPATPGNLEATPAITTMLLKWSASAAATGYVIRYGIEPGGAPTVLSATSTQITIDKLTKNTQYYFEVSAVNANGESDPARVIKKTLDGPALPTRPGDLRTTSTYHSIQAHWGLPQSPRYRASLIGQNEEEIETRVISYTTYVFRDLPPDTRYRVEVRGVNDSGESDASQVNATTKVFEAPHNLRRSKLDYESVVFEWLGNINDPVGTRYEIYLNGKLLHTISEERIHLKGLSSSTDYEFKVRAKTPSGYFSLFATDNFKTPVFAGWQICAPGHLKGKRLSATTAELDWEMPYATCEICPNAVGFEISGEGINTFEVLRPPCEVKGLETEVIYTLSVRAKAEGSNISKPSRVQIGAYPSKAGALQITNVTSRSATAKWGAAKGNVPVSEYIVYQDGEYIGSARGLEYQINELEPQTKYKIEVRSRANGSGLSEPVVQVFDTLEAVIAKPGTPTNFRYKKAGYLYTLEWDAPIDGGLANSYHIVLKTPGGIVISYDPIKPIFTSLLYAAQYEVIVTARNDHGESPPLVAQIP